jgi:DNA-binding NarL/FixJ family response regulator
MPIDDRQRNTMTEDRTRRNTRIRLVIADDHAIVRGGIRAEVERVADIVVVGEAATGVEALQLAWALRPDVLLQDLQLPDLDGLDVIRSLKSSGIPTRILAITGHGNRRVNDAMAAGADGYLTKDEPGETMIEAIRWAARGPSPGVWISPSAVEEMLRVREAIEGAGLTRTELAVLRLIGYENADIALRLHIAERTVRNHITSIYDKLGVHSRLEAIRWARRYGLAEDS